MNPAANNLSLMAPIVFVALGAVLLVAVLVLRNSASFQRGVPGWIAGLLCGVFLGAGAGLGAMYSIGYRWDKQLTRGNVNPRDSGTAAPFVTSSPGGGGPTVDGPAGGGTAQPSSSAAPGGAGGGMGPGGPGGPGGGPGGASMGGRGPGGGPGMAGMGGGGGPGGPGGGGMGGMGGGPGGAGQTPSSRQSLSAIVQKLDALLGGIELSDEQKGQLAETLSKISTDQALSDDEAKETLDQINATLTDSQKETLDSIAIPRRPAGMTPQSGTPDTYQNPFHEGKPKTSLERVRDKVKS